MVCVGKTEFGRPIYKSLKPQSYFSTYNDAYAALIEYNKNPYDLDNDITVSELYEKWTDVYFSGSLLPHHLVQLPPPGLLFRDISYARQRCPGPSYKELYGSRLSDRNPW